MNCTSCNTPHPGFELIEGLCHSCTATKLAVLQSKFTSLEILNKEAATLISDFMTEHRKIIDTLRYVAYQRLPLGNTVIETLPEDWEKRVIETLTTSHPIPCNPPNSPTKD